MGITNALVVDDSRLARLTLTKLLEKRSIQVEKASSAREAFETLKGHRPDLILMDVTMPDIDGLEATRMITNNPETSAIPVVMCTAEDSDEARNKAQDCGATAFLTKPAGDENLDRVLDEIAQQLEAQEPTGAPPVTEHATPPAGLDLEAILESARQAAREELQHSADTRLKELTAAVADSALETLREELANRPPSVDETSTDQEAQQAAQLAAMMAAEESAAETVRKLAEKAVDDAIKTQVRSELERTTEELSGTIRSQLTKQLDELLGSDQMRKRLEASTSRQAAAEAERVAGEIAQTVSQSTARETATEVARSEARAAVTETQAKRLRDTATAGKAKALASVALALSVLALAASAAFKFLL